MGASIARKMSLPGLFWKLKKRGESMKKLTPMRAIRAKCLECSNYQQKEVRECKIKKCALYAYRMGHRPKDEVFTADDD